MALYIEKAIFINRAPFEHLELNFKENSINVLSAINGKGKTTILSHIADAFYEMARESFSGSFEGKETKYYRFSSPLFNIDISKYSIVYFRFKNGSDIIDYIDCRGKGLTEEKYNEDIQFDNKIPFYEINSRLQKNGSIKSFSKNLTKDNAISILRNNIATYFPAYRFEQPYYLNDPYQIKIPFKMDAEFSGYLPNPIEVISGLPQLANWIMDVVLDWEIYKQTQNFDFGGEVKTIDVTPEHRIFMNINQILSSTLSSKKYSGGVRFGIGKRTNAGQRLSIMNDIDSNISKQISPNIFCLSSGESSLLCLFGEILRQWDRIRPNIDMFLSYGIVLIDEVDKHLHMTLQHNILPKLFNLFPNIQFIVSSHSPFLNMGLADIACERSQIIDLDNNGITCSPTNNELYKEVYELMVNENQRFADNYHKLEDAIKEIKKPLVITEGKTDIKFILKAKQELGLDVEFETIEPDQQPDGDSNLQKMLEQLSKVKNAHPIIGIFDRDIESTVKKMDEGEQKYKDYGNKVYGFCIPTPENRKRNGQEKISIEYLFSDDEIKSPVDTEGHRLFLGTEFTRPSMVHNECKNLTLSKPDGKGKDKILENNGGQAVYDENDKNILAKKDDFANAVVNGFINISKDSWENFRPILNEINKLSNL